MVYYRLLPDCLLGGAVSLVVSGRLLSDCPLGGAVALVVCGHRGDYSSIRCICLLLSALGTCNVSASFFVIIKEEV